MGDTSQCIEIDQGGSMHIVYLTNEFITETKKPRGGLATYLDNVTVMMAEKGHEITVIVLSYRGCTFCHRTGIQVICVKEVKTVKRLSDFGHALIVLINSWNIHCALKKLHKEKKVDIVQAADCLAVGFFRIRRIPTVLRASGDSAFWREASFPEFNYDRAMHKQTWIDREELSVVKCSDSVFAPSRCCADIIKKRSGRSIHVIESPYKQHDIEMDYSLYEKCLKGKEYLLFNSSLSYLKGTHLGIRAARQLMSRYPDLYLVYAGADHGLKGTEKSIAQILKEQGRRYQGRIVYLGRLSHEQLFPVIENSLACILPSRIDNLPNSCIEAMVFGKIVIGTYGASFEQLIRNKENGLLIKRDSVKSLLKAVDYLMNLEEADRVRMGENAKKTTKRLGSDLIYGQLITYYEKVIQDFKSKKYRNCLWKRFNRCTQKE